MESNLSSNTNEPFEYTLQVMAKPHILTSAILINIFSKSSAAELNSLVTELNKHYVINDIDLGKSSKQPLKSKILFAIMARNSKQQNTEYVVKDIKSKL